MVGTSAEGRLVVAISAYSASSSGRVPSTEPRLLILSHTLFWRCGVDCKSASHRQRSSAFGLFGTTAWKRRCKIFRSGSRRSGLSWFSVAACCRLFGPAHTVRDIMGKGVSFLLSIMVSVCFLFWSWVSVRRASASRRMAFATGAVRGRRWDMLWDEGHEAQRVVSARGGKRVGGGRW
jgi:hypothetical protein